jgi:hypothetical protein
MSTNNSKGQVTRSGRGSDPRLADGGSLYPCQEGGGLSIPKCQIENLQLLSTGIETVHRPLVQGFTFTVAKRLGHRRKNAVKRFLNQIVTRLAGRSKTAPEPAATRQAVGLQAGDLVRVRSEEEVRRTLSAWNELRGCAFLEGMWQYCGTTQRVLKLVERFVDERDAKGIVLLDGLMCQGTPYYGRCDRSCFYFWREEWLEKVE